MKKLLTFLSFLFVVSMLTAEVPQRISYQSVVRDADNNLVINSEVGMQISIQRRIDGGAVYAERHFVTTNDNGLVSLEIGDGTAVTGSMDDIDWDEGTFFIRTQVDPQGGANYTISGVSQILTVPYAFHAKTAEGLTEEIVETDPVFESSPASIISLNDISNWDEAFSWGDHSLADYIAEEMDPLFTASAASDIETSDIEDWDEAFSWGDHAEENYLTDESDPLFLSSAAAQIQPNDIVNWDEAFDWGDHADEDYLTEETDPLFSASLAADIEEDDIDNWDEAFSWGDHAEEDYLTEETQELADVLALGNDANVEQIKNLADPTDDQDAATKAYVDLLEEKIDMLLDRIETLEADAGIFIVQDIDGNEYQKVRIGDQTWMAENLRVTRYNNGDDIATGLDDTDWSGTVSGTYTIYPHADVSGIGSDALMVEAYGKLYNWYAMDDDRGICPDGWRVPDESDWNELLSYLATEGSANIDAAGGAGNALKSCRQDDSPEGGDCDTDEHPRWDTHTTHYGTDEFDFSALPGGLRLENGSFDYVGERGRWWIDNDPAEARTLFYNQGNLASTPISKNEGISIRCIRE